MIRYRSLVTGTIVLVALVVGFAFAFGSKRRAQLRSWTDPDTNPTPEQVAAVDPYRAYAALRPSPLAGPSSCRSAGGRVHRHYPANLAESPNSFVIGFNVGVGNGNN